MLLVLLLALASCTCAALSTVFKHRAAQRAADPEIDCRSKRLSWLPDLVVDWVANPVFALAMVFDAGCIAFQVLALKYGSLSVVQPVLCMALVISLGLNHLMNRTRPRRSEIVYSLTLVAGLIMFLVVSDAISAHGETAIGRKLPGVVLAIVGGVFVLGAVVATRRADVRTRARALAVSVAIIYATTAGLMKSSTQIAHLFGVDALLSSWQLWVLLALAGLGLVLNQMAYASVPLHVALPVVASLDPLFSVVIGVSVYGDRLNSSSGALVGEVAGLALLLFSVIKLSMVRSPDAEHAAADLDAEPGAARVERPERSEVVERT